MKDVAQLQLGRPTLYLGIFHQIRERTLLLRPKLRLPYRELQALAVV